MNESDPKNEELDDYGHDRRKTIKRLGGIAAGATIAVAGIATEYNRRHEERLRNLGRIVRFLGGEAPNETISIRGRKLDYPAFLKVCKETVGIKTDSISGVSLGQMAKDYGTMIFVEEIHGPSFRTNPLVENAWLQATRVRGIASRIPITASYGYAQIQAERARTTAMIYGEGLKRLGFLTAEDAKALNSPEIADHDVDTILRLQEDDTVLYGALSFIELYGQYAPETPSEDTKANSQRLFELALSGYTMLRDAPLVARQQTKLNEILIAKGFPPNVLIDIDGTAGENTRTVAYALFQSETPDEEKLDAQWHQSVNALFSEQNTDLRIGALRRMAERRYSTIMSAHSTALGACLRPSSHTSLENKFMRFIHERDSGFFDTISDKKLFETNINFSQGAFEDVWTRLIDQFKQDILFDEKYAGYVPTLYKPSRAPMFTGSQNVLERLAIADRIRRGKISPARKFLEGKRS